MSELLRQELASQAIKPPGKDRIIAAFSQSVLNMAGVARMAELESVVDSRANITPSYGANLLLRGFQTQLLKSETDYPRLYTTESVWQKAIDNILDDDAAYEQLTKDLTERNVQSNVVERYKAFKLVIGLLHDRLSEEFQMLDVGCSRNHGLKKLKLNLPFRPFMSGFRDTELFPSGLIDVLFNAVNKQSLKLGHSVGTDINPIDNDDGNAFWAKSCSFYPSELLDESAVTEYDYLDHNEVEGVRFIEGDFSAYGLKGRPAEKSFDVICASTFMYQLSDEDRVRARSLFRRYLAKDGVIVYQDFVRPSPDDRHLDFERNWFASLFPYRTLIEFEEDKTSTVHEVFRFDGGRCRQWAPGKDLRNILEYT
jgi:SAM-dependent methyltransferase